MGSADWWGAQDFPVGRGVHALDMCGAVCSMEPSQAAARCEPVIVTFHNMVELQEISGEAISIHGEHVMTARNNPWMWRIMGKSDRPDSCTCNLNVQEVYLLGHVARVPTIQIYPPSPTLKVLFQLTWAMLLGPGKGWICAPCMASSLTADTASVLMPSSAAPGVRRSGSATETASAWPGPSTRPAARQHPQCPACRDHLLRTVRLWQWSCPFENNRPCSSVASSWRSFCHISRVSWKASVFLQGC